MSFQRARSVAVEPAGEGSALERLGFQHNESDQQESLLRMPAVGGPFDANQEQAFQGTVAILLTGMKTWDMAFHCFTSAGLRIGIEFADQAVAVFFRRGREVGDEGFDQIPAGVFEGFGAAEVGGISLDESRIEVVLADQKAELVAEPWLAIIRAVRP